MGFRDETKVAEGRDTSGTQLPVRHRWRGRPRHGQRAAAFGADASVVGSCLARNGRRGSFGALASEWSGTRSLAALRSDAAGTPKTTLLCSGASQTPRTSNEGFPKSPGERPETRRHAAQLAAASRQPDHLPGVGETGAEADEQRVAAAQLGMIAEESIQGDGDRGG